MKTIRQNVTYLRKESEVNARRMHKIRSKEMYRDRERHVNKTYMQSLRAARVFDQREKLLNQQRMQQLRRNRQYTQKESVARSANLASRHTSSFELLQKQFWQTISVGPEYICCMCDQLWYKQSVVSAESLKTEHSSNLSSPESKQWVCRTCNQYIHSGKIPPLSKANNTTMPSIPPELHLHSLEERLVALRTPFMQIRELPRGRQMSMKGNVVNVPADVTNTVKMLPKRMDESHTIPVKFKRKLSYNHSVVSQNVRPKKVFDAANWLVTNSQLYKEEGVTLLQTWPDTLQTMEQDWREFVDIDGIDSTSITNEQQQQNELTDAETEMEPDSDDEWTEVINEDSQPSGSLDTMLTPEFTTEGSLAHCFAPSEGNHPLGLFQDKYCEELAFPTLFCGQPRNKNNVKVHYSEVCKWELRHKDRRFAKCVPNIFFKAKKLQINQIQQKVTLSLRKKKLEGKKLTAKDFKDIQRVQEILSLDEGFRVFRTLRGSPPYWENAKKELFAMIRQLGIPTWFMSFSAAETQWVHLLKILGRTLQNKEFTDSDILNMTWQEKSDLIQSDPVTCSRHFDYSVHRFISDVMQSSYHPVGHIIDYFYRVEFQQRGSPHIHMLAWIKDAPQYGSATNEQVVSFVDKYVLCNKPPSSVNNSVKLQSHSHAKTCRKKRQGVCRFGFPLPPVPRTMILTPASDSNQENGNESIPVLYKRIKEYLDGLKLADDVTTTFEEMLQILDMTEDQYVHAIRWSLTADKLFLKRSPSEIRVNAYNKPLLETWKANMDIQYVLDPYACAMYIVSYISKGQRGMSNLMQRATKEARDGNHDIKQRVRHIGNKFLNHVELSAQEAVYLVLQMSLRKATRQFVFINTSPPEDRTVLLKPLKFIQELPDDSTHVECMGLIKKYAARPKVLENYCLADFAAWFDVSTSKSKSIGTQDADEIENEDDPLTEESATEHSIESENEHATCYTVGALTFKKRNKAKIIRYVRFNEGKDPEKYYREQLMLFVPWRYETDILSSFTSYQDRYNSLEMTIKEKEAEYNHNSDALDSALESLENTHEELHSDIAPNSEHANEQDRLEKQKTAKEDGPQGVYDIGQRHWHNSEQCEYRRVT
ncbi:hypothetical protein HOLleu_44503 [Holothuria leucospilota]|uniref:ATP-dependent DNA helicase n=1 Tax=Holothuria leucospilota TaxID=206669 RepID=A0A9Q1B9C2_HOLLE|nr:hypothetical protein HOLleu_44503 [Holothuria leucospilota]